MHSVGGTVKLIGMNERNTIQRFVASKEWPNESRDSFIDLILLLHYATHKNLCHPPDRPGAVFVPVHKSSGALYGIHKVVNLWH